MRVLVLILLWLPLVLACSDESERGEASRAAGGDSQKIVPGPTQASTDSVNVPCFNETGEIRVQGPETLQQLTADVLEELPQEYALLVHCWLNVIKEGTLSGGSGVSLRTATYYVQGATSLNLGDRRLNLIYYAASIVHEAVHVREFRHSRPARGRDGELTAMLVQLEALEALAAPKWITSCLEEIVENIDDPAFQYWEGAAPPCGPGRGLP